MNRKSPSYSLYILRCADNRLYTGITTDLDRRINEHNDSKVGAKFTRGRGPVKLLYTKKFPNRSTASVEEARVKKLSRQKKLEVIQSSKSKSNKKV